jgi:hypothetical protein
VETWSVRALRDGQPFLAPAAGGGEVLTDRRLSLYAAWFESRFREFPAVRSYSLSPGGIAIAGLEPAPAEALLALPERREEIDEKLEGIYASIREGFFESGTARQRAERYEAAKSRLLAGLEEIAGEAGNAASLARKALSPTRKPGAAKLPAERERLLKKLDAALGVIKKSEVKNVAGFLFSSPETQKAADSGKGGGTDPFIRYLEVSARMYQDLAEAAEYQLGALRRS